VGKDVAPLEIHRRHSQAYSSLEGNEGRGKAALGKEERRTRGGKRTLKPLQAERKDGSFSSLLEGEEEGWRKKNGGKTRPHAVAGGGKPGAKQQKKTPRERKRSLGFSPISL